MYWKNQKDYREEIVIILNSAFTHRQLCVGWFRVKAFQNLKLQLQKKTTGNVIHEKVL